MRSEKNVTQKYVGLKKLWFKIILDPKNNFRLKKIWGPKKCWV